MRDQCEAYITGSKGIHRCGRRADIFSQSINTGTYHVLCQRCFGRISTHRRVTRDEYVAGKVMTE